MNNNLNNNNEEYSNSNENKIIDFKKTKTNS